MQFSTSPWHKGPYQLSQTRSMAAPFPYTPLEPNTIRLLHILPTSTPQSIQCTLSHHPFTTPYNALSYRWGDPTPVETITINNIPFGVARNLFDCLASFVSDQYDKNELDMSLPLWIDAICINQTDIPEKSVQVQQMWRVYTEATAVIAWLGLEDEYTAAAFSGLREMERQLKAVGENYPGAGNKANLKAYTPIPPEQLKALNALTANPYFSRCWIVQELICNKSILLTSGNYCAPYNLLASLQVARGQGKDFSKPASFLLLQRYDTQYHALSLGPVRLSPATQLYSWIYSTQHHECFDRRDRIFALLSLPTLVKGDVGRFLRADYAMSINELFLATLAAWEKLYFLEVNTWKGAAVYKVPNSKATRVIKEVINTVLVVQKTLGVDVKSAEFGEWLASRKEQIESKGELIVASATKIDCSGLIIQDLLGERRFVRNIDMRQIAKETELLAFANAYLETLGI